MSGSSDVYNWIGSSGGSWGNAADWQDVTTGQTPATAVPGSLTPVTISGPTGSIYEVISGGGSAASVALTGLIDLVGSYTYSTGALGVGTVVVSASTVTATSGSLELSTGSTVQASTVTVADGTLALNGSGVGLSASGAVTVGTAGGYPTTSYSPSWSGATGTLSLAGGASVTAASNLTVAYGSLTAQGTGTSLTIGENLVLGTAVPPTTATPPYADGESGSLSISNGAAVAVSGAITDAYYSLGSSPISVSGAGSSLTAGGTLTLDAAESGFGGTAAITSGGTLRVAGLSLVNTTPSVYGSSNSPSLSVDSTSIVEIGSAGSAVAGAITVDSGITVATAVSAGLLGNVVDNGVISETGGTLTISGALSGAGTVQIGTNASMTLNGTAAASATIAFTGASAALTIGASETYNFLTNTYTYTPYTVSATLMGFATGDGILVDNTALTNAVYTYGGNNTGTLALFAGATLVENLTLTGNYTGLTFLVAPTTGSSSAVVLLAPSTGGSSPVSTNSDVYNWIGSSGGSWGNAADWQDVTTGQTPATAVPGSLTPVTISGPTGSIYEVISGGGSAASVALTGLIDLVGSYTYSTGALGVGTVVVSASTVTATSGSLELSTGSTVQVSTVTVADGTLALNGSGVGLSASGAVTVGTAGGYPTTSYSPSWSGATGTLNLAGGASVTAASNLTVAYGSLTAQGTGTSLTIGGNLVLGTAVPPTTATPPYADGESGSLSISNGAAVAVSGAITDAYYSLGSSPISVSGAGSSLTAGGTLTLDAAESGFGGTAAITSGGTLRVAGLSLVNTTPSVYGSSNSPSLSVDSTSIVEIGSAGSAVAGAITVDSGITVATAVSAGLLGNVVDNGVISETGGTLTISGALSGAGTVQIGTNASMTLNGTAAASATIAFTGASAALTIGASETYNFLTNTYTYTPYTVSATLMGFATGDGILVDNTALTNAVYTYGGNNTGTLALFAGATLVENLTLTGNYTGLTFLVAPTTGSSSAVVLLAPSTGGSSPVSTNSDVYNWIGSSGGSWGNAADWQDVTTGQTPATAVPGSLTPVTISGPTGSIYEVISGGGSAASVALTGLIDLVGSYTYSTGALGVGTVVVSASTVTATSGSLELSTGSTVQASTVTVADGTLALNGSGVGLSASGAVTVGTAGGYPTTSYSPSWSGATGTLSLAGGASVTAASNLTVAYGSLTAQGTGTSLTIGENLVLGTAVPPTTATPPYADGESGSLSISNGAAVAVSGAITDAYYSLGSSPISVSGAGSSLTAGGTLTLDAAESGFGGTAAITSGGTLRVAGLSLVNTTPSVYGSSNSPSLSVDSTSIVEIGSAGSAVAGAITVDSGITVATAVSAGLLGNVVDNGVISETGGTLTISGALSGAGTVQIGTNASMTLNGTAAASATIAFTGASAALTIGASETYNFLTNTYTYTPYTVSATLMGFATGDGILVDNTALTNAVYTYGGNNTGTLALFAGATLVENLTLTGNYTNRVFFISPTTNGASAVTLLAQPGNTVPPSEAVLAGIITPFSGFSVSDSNAMATSITVTLADTNGLMSASNAGGGSVNGSGSTTLVISGTLPQVNADLTTLTYLSNTPGSDTIAVKAFDSLGSTSLQANVPVTVLPIAPPSITVPNGNVIENPGVTGAITSVSLTYPDAAVPGEQVSVTLTDTTGLLSVNAATAGGGGTVTGSGSKNLSIAGTLPQVDADLGTLTYLSGTPGSDVVTVSASAMHGGGAIPASFTVLTNAPPVTTVPASLTAIAGSRTLVSGVSVSDADAASAGETITVDLSDSVGELTATTAIAGGGGTITGSGSRNLVIAGSISQVDADLTTLQYLATQFGSGADTISVNSSDGRGGSDNHSIPVNIQSTTVTSGSRTFLADTYLPFPVVEGQLITGPVAVVADSNPGDPVTDFTATIDWGDGSPPTPGIISEVIANGGMIGYLAPPPGSSVFLVSPSQPHAYTDEGDFGDFSSAITFKPMITFTSPGSPSVTMTPTDTFWPEEGDTLIAQPVSFSATANMQFSGTVATFSDPTYPDNVPGGFTATIDWGDGTVTPGFVSGGNGSNFTVSGANTYANAGTYTVAVTLTDDAPGTATATADSTADVSSPPPLPPPPPTPPTSTGSGCPYFTTYDGLAFAFQGAGEFVAARSTVPGNTFQVQMRIEPEGGPDSSVSIITMIAVQVGNERVTFAPTQSPNANAGRAQVVWVDGAPVAISPSNPVFTLPGGTVSEVSDNEYRVVWNTGEVVTVNPFGDGMGLSVTLAPTDGPGSVQGFFGSDSGQATDFALPDGTVLQQPLTQNQFYQRFASAWRVTDSSSLFDYGPGQTTATFTDTMYPREILTLADFSPDLVSAAAALAAAAGITDPSLAAAAEFDYITMGDPTIFAEDALVHGESSAALTPAVITAPVTPPTNIGVMASAAQVTEASGGTTPVVFDVERTGSTTSSTVVDYAVVSGGGIDVATGQTFFSSADLGGVIPSGSMTIAAGQSAAAITINVPNSALGGAPAKWLQVAVTSPDGDPLFTPAAVTEIISNTPVAGTPAQPVLTLLSSAVPLAIENPETLAAAGNSYTLDLGQILFNVSLPPLQFSLANGAAPGADGLSSLIIDITGTDFQVSGSQPPATIAAGSNYQDLYFQPETTNLGPQSESLTITSNDVNDTGYSAALPDMTLTVTDSVIAPAMPIVNATTIAFPNVRVGTSESHAITVGNTAVQPAASLDVSMTAGTGSQATGTVSQLAPGGNDSTDLLVGPDTSMAGLQTGTVTLDFLSDLGNGVMVPALPSQHVTVTGSVYREASAGIALSSLISHVGDVDPVTVTNIAAADGYSENLIASLTGASGQISVASGGPTGEIAPGISDATSLSVSFSTAQAGTVAGSVTLALTSDGGVGAGSIDGLGQAALTPQDVPVMVTVDNYAVAALEEVSGGGTFGQNGTNYTLGLGTIQQNTGPVAINLGVLNDVTGPADLLSGNFLTVGSSAFTLSGFGAFSSLAAGQADTAPIVTLDTTAAGTFSETITLNPAGSNASGYMKGLPAESLTITAVVNAPVICFCAGTAIATPDGDVQVEGLSVGDRVLTLNGEARPIIWIGSGKVLATRGRRNEATPVIVRKGALADNVPSRDLRVTKGHSLFIDGVLIPVEFLVNHHTIMWDDRAQEVTIYHIELATHDVLVANGAPAESYRDDGNRWLFQNANTGWGLPPHEPCAPVLTGGPIVDAVWQRLLDRAGTRPRQMLTEDPDLHLLVSGERIDAASQHGAAHIFQLPAERCSVRVVSRAGAPAELGLARDPRVLGVAVQRIAVRQGTRFRVIEAADSAFFNGFHSFEADNAWRWTDGDAELPPVLFEGFEGPAELVLHVGCTTQYPLVGEPARADAA